MTARPIPPDIDESTLRRVLAKAEIQPDGCILWTGAIAPNGYGRVGFGKSQTKVAHRVIYVWATGQDVPEGLDLDHLCRVRACVNPTHLEPVARRLNIGRSTSRNAATIRADLASGRCGNGHDLTAPNAWAMQGASRVCRPCRNETARAYRARRAAGAA